MKTTDSAEAFEEWVRASLLPTLQEDVIAKIAGYAPGDLSEMIEVVREVEFAGYACTGQSRPSIPRKQQQMKSEETKRLSKIAYWEAARCGKASMWLHRLRMNLEEELERYENTGMSPR